MLDSRFLKIGCVAAVSVRISYCLSLQADDLKLAVPFTNQIYVIIPRRFLKSWFENRKENLGMEYR